jgi:hypothetical protein
MPETRRSKRILSGEDTSPRVRLILKTDPFLSSPEFTTDLYSTHSTYPNRSMAHRGRATGPAAVASSSNSMDIDSHWSASRSPYFSDEDSGSDGELNARGNGASSREANGRRKYTRRQDPAGSGTSTSLLTQTRSVATYGIYVSSLRRLPKECKCGSGEAKGALVAPASCRLLRSCSLPVSPAVLLLFSFFFFSLFFSSSPRIGLCGSAFSFVVTHHYFPLKSLTYLSFFLLVPTLILSLF